MSTEHGISATVIRDSLSPDEHRLTTLELCFPRLILPQFLTHRSFSRNAASSRAIPTAKLIEQVRNKPFVPPSFGANQRGMQAGPELPLGTREHAKVAWLRARDAAVEQAAELLKCGVHKQWANRLLEPFLWVKVLVSATEWSNFFRLRLHDDTQPEFQQLAAAIFAARSGSIPRAKAYGKWHLPYISTEDYHSLGDALLLRRSVARCARLGLSTPEKDDALFERLLTGSGFGHWCYDSETEVLTEDGWVHWPRWDRHQRVAAVDPHAGSVQFETASASVHQEYTGPMYHVSGQQLDLLVTPAHRMVVRARQSDGGWSPWRFEEAAAVAASPRAYLKAGNLLGRQAWYNPWRLDPAVFSRLIGFFVGDGAAETGNQIRFNLRLVKKISYLHSLGLPMTLDRHGRATITLPGIGAYLREYCYGSKNEKRLPRGYLHLTQPEVQGLWDGLRHSDGSDRRNTWQYDSTSRLLIDQIQALAHLNGQTASLSVRDRIEPQQSCWSLNFSDRITPRVECGQTGRARSYVEEWVDYQGEVFCATVSTGALLVRRRGKVAVSGNSPFEHCAAPDPEALHSGNFRGFDQYRKLCPGECG